MATKGKNSGGTNARRDGAIKLQTSKHTDDAQNKRHGNHYGPQRTRNILDIMEDRVRGMVPKVSPLAGRMAPRRNTRSKVRARMLELGLAGPSQD